MKVRWDDDIPNIWKKQCSKPPTSKWLGQAAVWRAWPRRSGLWRWDRSTRRSGWMDSASLPTSCKLRNCSKDVAPCLEYGKLKSTRQTAKPSGILYDYEHINNIIHIFQKKSKARNNWVRCNKGCFCWKGGSFVFCEFAPVCPSLDGFCITCLLIRNIFCPVELVLQPRSLRKTTSVPHQTMPFLRQTMGILWFVYGFPGDKSPTQLPHIWKGHIQRGVFCRVMFFDVYDIHINIYTVYIHECIWCAYTYLILDSRHDVWNVLCTYVATYIRILAFPNGQTEALPSNKLSFRHSVNCSDAGRVAKRQSGCSKPLGMTRSTSPAVWRISPTSGRWFSAVPKDKLDRSSQGCQGDKSVAQKYHPKEASYRHENCAIILVVKNNFGAKIHININDIPIFAG